MVGTNTELPMPGTESSKQSHTEIVYNRVIKFNPVGAIVLGLDLWYKETVVWRRNSFMAVDFNK